MLDLRSLAVGYRNTRGVVLSDIDLSAAAGDFVCILGRNGSGKSTLMRTIAGLQASLGGTASLDGEDIASMRPATRARRIGVVLTERAFNPSLNVEDVIALARQPFTGWQGGLADKDRAAIADAIEVTGVEHPGTAFQGREVFPVEGASMIPALSGLADSVHPDDHVMVWQINWRKAVRQGDWKIVSQADELFVRHDPRTDAYSWKLFNLAEDPAESNDLSAEHPDVLAGLLGHWEAYAEENDIVVPSSLSGF